MGAPGVKATQAPISNMLSKTTTLKTPSPGHLDGNWQLQTLK